MQKQSQGVIQVDTGLQARLMAQSMTSVGLKSPGTLSNFSAMQETPNVRINNSIWDRESHVEEDG